MISQLLSYLRDGFGYAERHATIATTIAALFVIPLAFLWSGQQFLDIGSDRAERLEKDRIGITHDAIILAVMSTPDREALVAFVEKFLTENPDLVSLSLTGEVVPGDDVSSGAPLDHSVFQEEVRAAALRTDESIIFEDNRADGRHWVGVRVLVDETGVVVGTLITDTSLAAVDTYIGAKLRSAYATLALVVGVIVLVLWRQARVVDYARLYRELKAAHETMSLFVNMTAHELRTPLTAIKWSANLIREDQEHAVEHATKIESVADALVVLINDLLDLARIQSGKMTFTTTDVDLTDVIVRTIALVRPLATERSLAVTTEFPLDHQHIVRADDMRFGQALTNVMSNALKYTHEGGITIALTRVGSSFEIRVKDTGMGISAEDQKRLFAPYFRVASPDVDRTTGTGLGMWITKRMIEEMGGTIDVESIKGVGTHIVITMPVAAPSN